MANEFVHGSQGTSLTQAEFEGIGTHVCNSQATGDLIYASSATQLTRLGIGATNTVLVVSGGIPSWNSTLAGLTITAPTINGTIATTGLTLPAFTAGGNISLGANLLLTTNLALRESNSTTLEISNAGVTAIRNLSLSTLYYGYLVPSINAAEIQAPSSDGQYLLFSAKDAGVALVEVARLQGAADAYFQMTLAMRLLPIATAALPASPVEGMLVYDDTANKLKVYNGTAWETVSSAA